jgi:hypothetical protein
VLRAGNLLDFSKKPLGPSSMSIFDQYTSCHKFSIDKGLGPVRSCMLFDSKGSVFLSTIVVSYDVLIIDYLHSRWFFIQFRCHFRTSIIS